MTEYAELAALADKLLEIADEDERELARILDTLDDGIRNELLVSDFLNACQVFYYFFREAPDEMARERLVLNPASELTSGVMVDEIEELEVIMGVRNGTPVVSVSDGDRVIARFTGTDAYHHARSFIDEQDEP
ncbi:MAG: hypothetical protein ACP5C4_01730 [Methanomicrobiales archaeon]